MHDALLTEAVDKPPKRYTPDWKTGDLFSHALTYPAAEKLGILGWNILMYKVGEYTDIKGRTCQLLYISLCPPDQLPGTEQEFSRLKFLRMMQLGERSEYLGQMTIRSKQEERFCGFTRIGCYPELHRPDNAREENPLTAMPLLGRTRQSDQWPGFEDQICRLYRKFGL